MENQFNRAKARLRKKQYVGFIHSLPTYIISPPRMEMMLYVGKVCTTLGSQALAPISEGGGQCAPRDCTYKCEPRKAFFGNCISRRGSQAMDIHSGVPTYITRPSCQQWFPKVRDGPSFLEAPPPGRARMGESWLFLLGGTYAGMLRARAKERKGR